MSSSSSPEPAPLRLLVARSLGVLEREHPTAHGSLCAIADGLVVVFELGEPRFEICFEGSRALVADPESVADARVRCTPATIGTVLAGKSSVRDVVLSGELLVHAAPPVIDRLERAFATYVAGGFRCPGFHDLLVAFRRR